eukprot:2629377-Amphidinium_carterae.1
MASHSQRPQHIIQHQRHHFTVMLNDTTAPFHELIADAQVIYSPQPNEAESPLGDLATLRLTAQLRRYAYPLETYDYIYTHHHYSPTHHIHTNIIAAVTPHALNTNTAKELLHPCRVKSRSRLDRIELPHWAKLFDLFVEQDYEGHESEENVQAALDVATLVLMEFLRKLTLPFLQLERGSFHVP